MPKKSAHFGVAGQRVRVVILREGAHLAGVSAALKRMHLGRSSARWQRRGAGDGRRPACAPWSGTRPGRRWRRPYRPWWRRSAIFSRASGSFCAVVIGAGQIFKDHSSWPGGPGRRYNRWPSWRHRPPARGSRRRYPRRRSGPWERSSCRSASIMAMLGSSS